MQSGLVLVHRKGGAFDVYWDGRHLLIRSISFTGDASTSRKESTVVIRFHRPIGSSTHDDVMETISAMQAVGIDANW